jgi:hypothetical protein
MSFGCSSEDGGAGVRTNARFLTEGMQQKSGKKREKRTRDETRREPPRGGRIGVWKLHFLPVLVLGSNEMEEIDDGKPKADVREERVQEVGSGWR